MMRIINIINKFYSGLMLLELSTGVITMLILLGLSVAYIVYKNPIKFLVLLIFILRGITIYVIYEGMTLIGVDLYYIIYITILTYIILDWYTIKYYISSNKEYLIVTISLNILIFIGIIISGIIYDTYISLEEIKEELHKIEQGLMIDGPDYDPNTKENNNLAMNSDNNLGNNTPPPVPDYTSSDDEAHEFVYNGQGKTGIGVDSPQWVKDYEALKSAGKSDSGAASEADIRENSRAYVDGINTDKGFLKGNAAVAEVVAERKRIKDLNES
jgi:hypothetical protein